MQNMQNMKTIKAIYDGAGFKPVQPIPVKENYEVLITFVEPLEKDANPETKKLPRKSARGILSGKVFMAEDFNAPIEDMKGYME